MRKLLLLATLLAVATAPAFAGSILYWTDFNVGTSVIPDAIILAGWVAGGGKAIGATWLGGSGFATLFEGSLTAQNGFSIPNTGGPIFAGISGDVGLYNPGWGVFSQYYSPTGTASCVSSLSGYGCAIVLGNGGNTLLDAPHCSTRTPTTIPALSLWPTRSASWPHRNQPR